MKTRRLAIAVYQEIEKENITLSALAVRIRHTQGALSQLFTRGLRANPETVKKLTHGWKAPGAGARVLIAHLQDEIDRSGWPVHGYNITHKGKDGEATQSQLEADLEDIRAAAEYIPALACLVADVLAVARAEMPGHVGKHKPGSLHAVAADPGHEYKTKGQAS
jgi:hypothetical protein